MSILSTRLQQARISTGLSLRALANLVQLSHAAIKKYEDGALYPSSDMLLKLAKALNVRVDFFFRPIKVSLENIKFRKRQQLKTKAEEAIKFEVLNKIERPSQLELGHSFPPNSSISTTSQFSSKN